MFSFRSQLINADILSCLVLLLLAELLSLQRWVKPAFSSRVSSPLSPAPIWFALSRSSPPPPPVTLPCLFPSHHHHLSSHRPSQFGPSLLWFPLYLSDLHAFFPAPLQTLASLLFRPDSLCFRSAFCFPCHLSLFHSCWPLAEPDVFLWIWRPSMDASCSAFLLYIITHKLF